MEKELADANAFFEEVGILDAVNEFLNSEKVVDIVKNSYEQYVEDITNCCNMSPKGLRQLAENLKTKYIKTQKEEFKNDFECNFKRQLVETLRFMKDFMGGETINVAQHVIQDIEKAESKYMLRETNCIISDMLDTLRGSYIKELYSITTDEDED